MWRTVNKEELHTEFVNADFFEVLPSDACRLFYAAEAFAEQVVQVDIKTQQTQPFLHARLHNRTQH